MRIMGPTLPGGYAEEVVVRDSMLRPIPDSLSFDDAALAEPLAVAVHAANRGWVGQGDRVAILGIGAIGLLQQQVVKAKGAGFVLVTGRTEKKLAMAEKLGADEIVNVTKEELVTPARANSFDVIIDLVCSQSTIDQGMALAGIGGRIVHIASPDAGQPAILDMHRPEWVRKELAIMKSKIYDMDFDEAVPLMVLGKVKAASIITHRFPLDRVQEALESVIKNRQEVVKAILEP
jgi:threonine dehydrogenase-like Zn-dependent dehydrogenase